MKTSTDFLIADLIERTRQNMNAAAHFQTLPEKELNRRPAPEKWSILECIEHLNLYGDYYNPEIERRIKAAKHPAEPHFNSGLLGDYFAKSMLPKEKLNKMKTFKDKNPLGSKLDKKTLNRFTDQQHRLLELLERARSVSLNKTKVSISISKLVKLKLGDTFRFVIYHNQRHIVQANKVLDSKTVSHI